ncbi:hypothetical protein NMC74_14535, partial [Enterococcus faecium]|nr:hypothetical protein [Enterococcus faecium]
IIFIVVNIVMYCSSTRSYFYRLGIFKYQRLSWKSCAPPLVFPSGSFVARIMTYTFLLGKLRMLKDT